jgi:GNAT superfamily N-acetyltransferase
MRLRRATADDVAALGALYAQTARALGAWCYTPAQVQAWAGFGEDLEAFRAYVLEPETWIAVDDGGAALGFSGIDAGGEVRSLYVRHDTVRKGIGSALLAQVLSRGAERGLAHFAAWATPFSLPVFERAGFELTERVRADFHGAEFERLRVER